MATMATYEWREDLATGHPDVDIQHRNLILMVNDLHEAIASGRGREVLSDSLDNLASYCVNHFKTEESFMLAVRYPDYLEHKHEHDTLTKQALTVIEGYRAGTVTLTLTLSQFLAKWITGHIEGHDLRMVQFVRAAQAASVQAAHVAR